ncbi:CueP family metal-binding protein, partial [Alkalihalophilus lindianensis]|nr:CueP family metal-binding protein [Alkalihalophilus lindianensis]
FIDLWLPRNKTYQMKIELDGKKVESGLSTFNDDPTCITTMQLM